MTMNDELKNKSVEILTQIQQAVQSGAEVAGQQIPEIARQYVVYGIVMNWAMVLFFSVVIMLLYRTIRLMKKSKDIRSDTLPFMIFSALSFIPLCVYFESALLVTLAPKVWLIKEIADFIK